MTPYVISFVSGLVTAIILAASTPLFLLGEMGGPADFRGEFLIVVGAALLITVFLSRAKGGLRGCLSGVIFAIPVAVGCLLISHSSDIIHTPHAKEVRGFAIIQALISVIAMSVVAHSR